MLMLKESVKHESKTHPGVSFRVRVLSVVERILRDGALSDARERLRKIGAESLENVGRAEALDEEAMRILTTEIVPHYIRHGLVSIEGVGDENGEIATAELLIRLAPADLLMELYFACREAGGLDADMEKNWQRSGTSPAAVDGATTPTIAGPVNGAAGTSSATVPSTSLAM